MGKTSNLDFQKDIEDINEIPGIHTLLDVISRSSNMRFVAVARVTEDRWITGVSKDDIDFGLRPGDELDVNTTICNEIREHHIPVVIDDVDKNVMFCNHYTPKMYGFKSYISYPIFLQDGSFFGTLCAIDPKPSKLNTAQIRGLFELYTDLISFHLESIRKLDRVNKKLQEERHLAELKETFIAILGHDLHNPIRKTRICSEIILASEIPDAARRQAETIKSTSLRMQGIVGNLLDFAKGNLEEGIRIKRRADNELLKNELLYVVSECRSLNEDQEIDISFGLNEEIFCDIPRIAQLLSNLVSNASRYSRSGEAIKLVVTDNGQQFIINVTNKGEPIPEQVKEELFHPFFKAKRKADASGFGLGLYISSEIAKAHSGKISVKSENGETSFIFSMPLQPARQEALGI